MSIDYRRSSNGCGASASSACPTKDGCPPDRCPDFVIRRHDTMPHLKVSVEECTEPLDVQGLVVEVNMWALAKLRKSIEADTEYFALADNIGFEQIMINDIIVMDRVRLPEYMLVTGFDEENGLVRVQRGYRGTTPGKWKKGTRMRIFRILNGIGQTEMVYEDIREVDGTLTKNVLSHAYLVYNWKPEDTCLPGCYWLEFKVLKMKDLVLFLPGGNWTGPTNLHDDGFYYTGTTKTESSVKLSYDSVNDRYIIPTDHWTGEHHYYSGDFYTGIEQNNGSVWLNRNDQPFDVDREQSEVPPSVEDWDVNLSALATSVIPSFTPSTVSITPSGVVENFDPTLYGCWLGADVEWARRLPVDGEGLLIKITSSPTMEI